VTTKVDVLNEALLFLGQPPMAGPADTSTWVRRLNDRYTSTVRLLLEQHPWNFSSSIEPLQRLPETPPGWAYTYNKPAKLLRLNWINDSGDPEDDDWHNYDDVGGKILSDYETLYASYISSDWIIKEGSWPQVFARAVSAELAFICAPAVTRDRRDGDSLYAISKKSLKTAKSWDASQKPFRQLPRGSWSRARRSGPRYNTEGR